MKALHFTKTLYYYDGPQVVELKDEYGGYFIALMIATDADGERFVATGVSPGSLRRFREGASDLRTLMLEYGDREWYLSQSPFDFNHAVQFEPQQGRLSATSFLPDDGFTIHVAAAATDALAEARARNNLVLDISVTPPEAAMEHRIRANTLAGLLLNMQKLVQHAYGAARRELSLAARRRVETTGGHLLDVIIPAAPGSFRIMLEAVQTPNLVGQTEVSRALSRIDALFSDAATPRRALDNMKKNRGHLAAAYLRLLKFLDENKMGIQYSWAEPNFSQAQVHSVSMSEVASLVDALAGVANLGAEEIVIEGALEKADERGQWRLMTADGSITGTTKDGGPSLRGLRIASRYRFSCIEEIEEFEGTGREKRSLYLLEHEPS